MGNTYWHKQIDEKPLFPDLLWSKPETRRTAGKLLIIGGNVHGFAAVGQAYTQSGAAGVGVVRVILPDVLKKTVSLLLPEANFAASTPSGSFAQQALAQLIDQATWADAVLLAGDLGRNSETAILLEKLISKYSGQLTITKDAMDYFTSSPNSLVYRSNTTLVLTMAQLQKLGRSAKFDTAFKFDMDVIRLIESLHDFTLQFKSHLIIKQLDTIFVAVDGRVSTTKTKLGPEDVWRLPVAAKAAVWWLQNPTKAFEALTTSIVDH